MAAPVRRPWPLEPGLWQVTVNPGDVKPPTKEIEILPGPAVGIAFP